VQQFKFFLTEVKNMQQTYDFPDSLINILETRFNIRKEEAELERKVKVARESIKKLEEALKLE
jgi:hypothetical protein